MRIVFLALVAALLSGCIGQNEQTTTTTIMVTTTTLEEIPSKQLILYAGEHLSQKGIYDIQKCSQISLAHYGPGECIGCEIISLRFTCPADGFGPETLDTHLIFASYEPDNPLMILNRTLERSCVSDADCLPDEPVRNTRYSCIGRICHEELYDSPMGRRCIENGHHIMASKLTDAFAIYICVFSSGDYCEIESYYFGLCDEDSRNLSRCLSPPPICRKEYAPVCGRIIDTSSGNETVVWMDFDNACIACQIMGRDRITVSYRYGPCPSEEPVITIPEMDEKLAEARFCEEMGYAYRIREYSPGREYAVCVFGLNDECPADKYFRGECMPMA